MLCDAEITTLISAFVSFVRYAIAGVGATPTSSTFAPLLKNPAVIALSINVPEILVSLPIIILGFTPSLTCFVNTSAPAFDMAYTNSGVSSVFAILLIPSVPKYFILYPSFLEYMNKFI